MLGLYALHQHRQTERPPKRHLDLDDVESTTHRRLAALYRLNGDDGTAQFEESEAERYAAEGHFGTGSMAPKVEAIVKFVNARPGARGVITNSESIARALRGETGTWIRGA